MLPKADASTLDPSSILDAANLLRDQGYFTDEGGPISSVVMEKDLEGIEGRVRRAGYQGGELKLLGHTRKDHTAVYIVFDTQQISHAEATRVLKRA